MIVRPQCNFRDNKHGQTNNDVDNVQIAAACIIQNIIIYSWPIKTSLDKAINVPTISLGGLTTDHTHQGQCNTGKVLPVD